MTPRPALDAAALRSRLGRRAARDPLLRDVRRLAHGENARVWLVGGYVRDTALGGRAGDVDLVAGHGARRFIAAARRQWETRGFRFRKRGVTTWRFVVAGRRVDVVDAARRGLNADLNRRELTVNAIAWDLRTAELVDPCGGLADLARGRMRLTRSGVFGEDPLRALRACRFLAQLGRLRLTAPAERATVAAAPRLRRAAVERVCEELDKLLCAPLPHRGLDAMARLGLRRAVLPELEPLADCTAGGDARPDVWTHTLETLRVAAAPRRLPAARLVTAPADVSVLRWSLLLHDIAKPETLKVDGTGRPAFHGHEVLGAQRADALMRRLRLGRAARTRVRRLITLHLRPGHLADAGPTPRGLRRLVRDAEADLPLLVLHAACDARGSGARHPQARWRRLRRVLLDLLELHATRGHRPQRLVDGRDVMRLLGIAAGPDVGRWLARLADLQLAGELHDRRQALRWLRDAGRVSAGKRAARGSPPGGSSRRGSTSR